MSNNKVVFKYNIPIKDEDTRVLAGKVVHVAQGPGSLYVWVEHDPRQDPKEYILLRVFGTGHEIPTYYDHRGTIVQARVGLVWHLYQVNPARKAEAE